MPEKIRYIFTSHFIEAPREFIMLLQCAKENGFTHRDIERAADSLGKRVMRALSADSLKVMMHSDRESTSEVDRALAGNGGGARDQHSMIECGAEKTLRDISMMMNARANAAGIRTIYDPNQKLTNNDTHAPSCRRSGGWRR